MNLDITKIPFSAYGSYFVLSVRPKNNTLYIRDIHGGDEAPSYIYSVELEGHSEDECEILHLGTELLMRSRKNPEIYAGFVMGTDGDQIYVRTKGTAVHLYAEGGSYDTLVPLSENVCEHHLSTKQIKVLFTCRKGSICQKQDWMVRGSSNAVVTIGCGSEVVIESYRAVRMSGGYVSYEEAKAQQEKSFGEWEESFPNPDGEFEDSRMLAAYITWMNFVHAEGRLTRDAMYMSKNWMYNIWSWDNCFAGIALSSRHPETAFDQMKVFIDTQDVGGCYPDFVNETFASYGFVKPPIHAWAFAKMMQQNPALCEEGLVREMYESLKKMTFYWLDYRKNEKAVFPVYYHGNDSGWDNASVFRKGMPVESPDLAAFLIYQMDRMAEIAETLGEDADAKMWKMKADEAFSKFFDRFYEDGRFYAIYTPEEAKIYDGNSLLMYLPVMIGYRFEKKVLDKLVENLLAQFETPFGLATEAPDSPYYKKGGYWLGPVWAPTTYLFIDALRSNGYAEAAERLSEKFCKLTEIGLMSENYDPFTGEGYDDPAFSWPSCVLLQILREKK